MLSLIRSHVSRLLTDRNLPEAAVAEMTRDRSGSGLSDIDPPLARVVEAAIDWLCRAQDNSKSQDERVELVVS